MAARSLHERAMQRPHVALAKVIRLRAEFLHRLPHFLRSGRCRHRLSERHGHGIRNPARQLPQKSPALETENRTPHPSQIHRDDRHVQALYDSLHSATKRKHLADARHLAFGENANNFSILESLGRGAQRLNHLPRTKLRRDRNHAHDLGERLHQPVIVGTLEHEESNRTVDGGDQQNRVHHRNVIRYQQCTALGGNIFAPLQMHSIKCVGREPQQQPQQRIGQQIQDVRRRRHRHQRGREKYRRWAEMPKVLEEVINAGCTSNTHKRKQVRRGDHAAFIFFVGPVLNQGVDGNGKEARRESQSGKQRQHTLER